MALRLANNQPAAEPEQPVQPQKKKQCAGRGARYWALTWFKEDLLEPVADQVYWDPLLSSDNMDKFSDANIVYMLYQVERCPTTQRLHLQMFVQFKNQVRLPTLAGVFPGCHAEPCRASEKDNERYCSKCDSRIAGPWTYGKKTSQGKRTDWDDVKDMASGGSTRRDIVLAHPKLAPCVKGIDVIIAAVKGDPPLERPVTVWVLHGPPGVGKTHRARHRFPDAFVVTGKYYEGKSFDSYADQDTLILDEWKHWEWPITLMNGLLDKWRVELQCRYFNKWARWSSVVICSNEDPSTFYSAEGASTRAAFERRLTFKILVETQEQQIDF